MNASTRLERRDLDAAVAQGLIRPEQAAPLWQFLLDQETARRPDPDPDTPRFKPAHILYYLGGLIAIGAMTLFMTLGWESFGGGGLLLISLVYAGVAVGITTFLLARGLALPAGLTGGLAVAMTPLAVYGAQHLFGMWPEGAAGEAYRQFHTRIDWRWLMMELATLATGAIALWRWRLPFLMLPVAVTLWYLGMDIVPVLLGGDASDFFSTTGRRVSTAFGALMLLAAAVVDFRSSTGQAATGTRPAPDFAFWLYVFGLLTFWCGLTSLDSDSEWNRLAYAGINLLLIAIGAALSRRVFAVFGGLGVALYLGHLSYTVFKDSLLFPVALTAIGLATVAAGIVWQRHEAAIGERLRALLPARWQTWLAVRAAA